MTDNIFLKSITEGKIRSLEELKSVYRKLMLRTHPDAVGSNRFVEQFLAYSNHYEEAKEKLKKILTAQSQTADIQPNWRLCFYKELYRLERINKPFTFYHDTASRGEIDHVTNHAQTCFSNWRRDMAGLYQLAMTMYEEIKHAKPIGPYRKDELLYNLSPVFHNICSYQLTGLPYYKRQIKQNLEGILSQLEKKTYYALKEMIEYLIQDMENEPAILDSSI